MLNIRWLGVPTENYRGTREFFESVLGLRVQFDDATTVELATEQDDRVQLFAPDNPHFERFRAPITLFEVDDVRRAQQELQAAGIEVVGERECDAEWEWLHVRAPDGNLYALGSRKVRSATARDAGAP